MIKYSLEGIAEIKKHELKTISKDKILKYELQSLDGLLTIIWD